MLANPGAEIASAEGWEGLEALARGEYGVRRGEAHSGDYCFYWRGQSSGISSDWIAIDTNQSYEVSGWFKAGAPEFSGLTFGMLMADEHQRSIKHVNVFSLKGTQTELARDCRSGDRLLYLKNAAGWQAGKQFAAAFGVQENQLTFEVTPPGIEHAREVDGIWEVGLATPCGVTMPAGTAVVENSAGGNGIFFTDATNITVPMEWTELKGVVNPKQWWDGIAYVKLVVIGRAMQRQPDAPELWLDDFSLKVIE